MKKYAVIVAGGSGSRMKSDIPKQFLTLQDLPVLIHTIKAFKKYDSSISIILVLPSDQISYWMELTKKHDYNIEHQMVGGGTTRFESVRNGLDAISDDGLVAIHDGARPLTPISVISSTFDLAERIGNATAAVALKDSIRKFTLDENHNVDRSLFKIIQTPQTFKVSSIKAAFSQANTQQTFTDDASVLESMGEKINLVEGSYENIKITTPEDLIVAEAILKYRQ